MHLNEIYSHGCALRIFSGNFLQDLFFEKENISDGASDVGWADAAALGFESAGEGLKLYAPKQFRMGGQLHSLAGIGCPRKLTIFYSYSLYLL